jgi:hypothetical protein
MRQAQPWMSAHCHPDQHAHDHGTPVRSAQPSHVLAQGICSQKLLQVLTYMGGIYFAMQQCCCVRPLYPCQVCRYGASFSCSLMSSRAVHELSGS